MIQKAREASTVQDYLLADTSPKVINLPAFGAFGARNSRRKTVRRRPKGESFSLETTYEAYSCSSTHRTSCADRKASSYLLVVYIVQQSLD